MRVVEPRLVGERREEGRPCARRVGQAEGLDRQERCRVALRLPQRLGAAHQRLDASGARSRLGDALCALGVLALDDGNGTPDECGDERDCDRCKPPSEAARGVAGGDDVGVACLTTRLDEGALGFRHRPGLDIDRLDRGLQPRAPVELRGGSAGLVPRPCRASEMLKLVQPSAVLGDPGVQPFPSCEQCLMSHFDRGFAAGRIAISDQQPRLDIGVGDVAHRRGQLAQPHAPAGVRPVTAGRHEPAEQRPSGDLSIVVQPGDTAARRGARPHRPCHPAHRARRVRSSRRRAGRTARQA